MSDGPDADTGSGVESTLFTYAVPFVGVLLVAVGIAAAVPGVYAIIQEDLSPCGSPTIAVESPTETDRRFGGTPPATVERLDFEALSPTEQAAFETALDDPIGEAHVEGEFPHGEAFRDGVLVRYENEEYYATVVSENPCFRAAPLQFPLGVFAIALGLVGILTPPAYRKLVALETGAE